MENKKKAVTVVITTGLITAQLMSPVNIVNAETLTEPTQITDWYYTDFNIENNTITISDFDDILSLNEVISRLPASITTVIDGTEQTIDLQWNCEDYPSQGTDKGTYTYVAPLQEGYEIENNNSIELQVILEEKTDEDYGISLLDNTDDTDTSTSWGWNEAHTVYKVVGQNGYPETRKEIELPENTTLDLTQADPKWQANEDNNWYSSSNCYPFYIAGDNVTLIGNPNTEYQWYINFSSSFVTSITKEDITINIKNFKFSKEKSYCINSNIFSSSNNIRNFTINYSGSNQLNELKVPSKDTELYTLSLIGEDKNSTLECDSISSSISFNLNDSKYYTDQGLTEAGIKALDKHASFNLTNGNVTVNKQIEAHGDINVDNCDLTVNGYIQNGITNYGHDKIINWFYQVGEINFTNSTVKVNESIMFENHIRVDYYDIGYITRNQTSMKIDKSTITCEGIGGAKDISINDSNITSIVSSYSTTSGGNRSYLAGVGLMFETMKINNSTIEAQGANNASGGAGLGFNAIFIPFYSNSDKNGNNDKTWQATITIEDSDIKARSYDGAGIGLGTRCNSYGYDNVPMPIKVDIEIKGKSNVYASSITGSGIGSSVKKSTIINPDGVILDVSTGGDWEPVEGGDGEATMFSLKRLARTVATSSDSDIPNSLSDSLWKDYCTLTISDTSSGSPTIEAVSGNIAIGTDDITNTSSKNLFENTLRVSPENTTPIYVGEVKFADYNQGVRSIAKTEFNLPDDPFNMYYSENDNQSPLADFAVTPYNTTFEKNGNINRLWTTPLEAISGDIFITDINNIKQDTYPAETTLKVDLTELKPSYITIRNVKYRWYKNGKALQNSQGIYPWQYSITYKAINEGIYYCEIIGDDNTAGNSIFTNAVYITNDDLIAAPTLDSRTTTSITLKTIDGYKYQIIYPNSNEELDFDNAQNSPTFNGLEENTLYYFIQYDNNGNKSAVASFRTAGEKPTVADISYNYVTENIYYASDITVYSDEECTQKINSGAVIEEYIGETLYARYNSISDTGDDVVLEFNVPERPEKPTMLKEDITIAQNEISFYGASGIEYALFKGDEQVGSTISGQNENIVFENLDANTSYTIKYRVKASNETRVFHSEQAHITVKTLDEDKVETTILVSKNQAITSTNYYDLSDVIEKQTGKKLTIDGLDTQTGLNHDGNTIQITNSISKNDDITIKGTLSNENKIIINIHFVETVGQTNDKSGNPILWVWRFKSDGVTISEDEVNDNIYNTETIKTNLYNRELVPLYSYGINANTIAEVESSEVVIPYFTDDLDNKEFIILKKDYITNEITRREDYEKTDNGLKLTVSSDDYGVYYLATVESYPSYISIKYNDDIDNIFVGDTIRLEGITTPLNITSDKTMTWSSDDSNIAIVDQKGNVTARSPGKANITVKITGQNGPISDTCTIIVTKDISNSLSITQKDIIYGNMPNPSGSIGNENEFGKSLWTYYYKEKNANDSTYSTEKPTNAGEYTIKAEYKDDYQIGKTTIDFKISPLPVKLSWGDNQLTYNGEKQSVSAEISNLIDGDKCNLIYENNKYSEVGQYTASIKGLSNDNYTLENGENTTYNWSIQYLDVGNADISGDKKNKDWYTSEVTIKKDNYKISQNGTNWLDEITLTNDGTYNISYYLKDGNGSISAEKKTTIKIDQTNPSGKIEIKDNSFTQFLNTITFGYFFKDTVDVKISGTDKTSGIASIEYQKVKNIEDYNGNGEWVKADSFSIKANDKSIIYARITDYAGNVIIINSANNIVYTDSNITKESIDYTKLSKQDKEITIDLNGNTVKEICVNKTILTSNEYTLEDNKLILKGDYLETLSIGDTKVTISYNALGYEFSDNDYGDKPSETNFTIHVMKKTLTDDNFKISLPENIIYDTQNHPVTIQFKDDIEQAGDITVKYYKDDKLIDGVPTEAGTYTIKIDVSEGKFCNAAENISHGNWTFTIKKATPIYVLPTKLNAVYGNTLDDVELPDGFTWQDKDSTSVGNVGTNTFKVIYTPEDTANYNIIKDIEVSMNVGKANPSYEVPTLNTVYGNTLEDIKLPDGFTWQDDVTISVGNAGTNTFKVTYTPEDTANFNIIKDISVILKVNPKDVKELTIPKITKDSDLQKLEIKDGDNVLLLGVDYDITQSVNNNEVIITIEFKGNYTGVITKSYSIEQNQEIKSKNSTKTGDYTNIGLWTSLIVIASTVFRFIKKKKEQ